MELIERNDHWLEVNDGEIPTKHYSKFVSFNGKLVRMDTDPATGDITPSMFTPRALITSDKATGEIKQHQIGFILEHELLGPGTHSDATLEYVQAILPADFTKEVTVDVIEVAPDGTETTLPDKETITRVAYKVVAGKLVKLTVAKLNAPIKK